MDKIAPLSEVRSNLSGIVSELARSKKRLIVTRNGKPAAVIISPEELETLEILADSDLAKSLSRAIENAAAGRLVSHEELFGGQ